MMNTDLLTNKDNFELPPDLDATVAVRRVSNDVNTPPRSPEPQFNSAPQVESEFELPADLDATVAVRRASDTPGKRSGHDGEIVKFGVKPDSQSAEITPPQESAVFKETPHEDPPETEDFQASDARQSEKKAFPVVLINLIIFLLIVGALWLLDYFEYIQIEFFNSAQAAITQAFEGRL